MVRVVDTDRRAALVDLFDQHATLRIDSWAYRGNEVLREVADRVLAMAGLEESDVTKQGLTLHREYATIEVFERTADGERIVIDGEHQTRIVCLDYGRDA